MKVLFQENPDVGESFLPGKNELRIGIGYPPDPVKRTKKLHASPLTLQLDGCGFEQHRKLLPIRGRNQN